MLGYPVIWAVPFDCTARKPEPASKCRTDLFNSAASALIRPLALMLKHGPILGLSWMLTRPTRIRSDMQGGAVPHRWLHRVHTGCLVSGACVIGTLQVPAAGMFRTVAIWQM